VPKFRIETDCSVGFNARIFVVAKSRGEAERLALKVSDEIADTVGPTEFLSQFNTDRVTVEHAGAEKDESGSEEVNTDELEDDEQPDAEADGGHHVRAPDGTSWVWDAVAHMYRPGVRP